MVGYRQILLPFALFVLLLICAACKDNQIQISGKFENVDRCYLLLSKIEPDNVIFLDTLLLLNGTFLHTLTEENVGVYLLKYNDSVLLSFIAQNGDRLVFSGDARDLNKTYDVQGNEETRLLLETRRKLNLFYDKTKEWSAIFLQHTYAEDSETVTASLDSLYKQEFDAQREYLMQFIREHKGKLAALLAFYQKIGNIAFFDEQKDRALLQEIYTALALTYPNSIYVEDLKEKFGEKY